MKYLIVFFVFAVFSPKALASENSQYDDLIKESCVSLQLELNLIKAIIKVESNYDPLAVSKAGAQGLMQLMPKTAESLGVKDPFNPSENIKAGCLYFSRLLKKYEHLTLALSAYNAGGKVYREEKRVPEIPETKKYIRKVMREYRLLKNEHEYFGKSVKTVKESKK